MSFDTYANLQTEITNWLKRSDLAANIPSFITLAEKMLARKLTGMNPQPAAEETTQTGSLVVTTNPPMLLALPTGYQGTKRFQLQIAGEYRALAYKTPAQAADYYASGEPHFFTTNGNYLEIMAPADSTYTYNWTQYVTFSALSASNTTNWLLTAHPDLYLYAALLQAEPFMKNDKRIEVWGALLGNALTDFELQNTRNRQSGGPLQVRSDAAIR